MNILQVNKFWFENGGVESYLAGVMRELERRGHALAEFGMQHPENRPSPWAGYFAPHVELRSLGRELSPAGKLRASARILYEPRVARDVGRLCAAFGPDVAHVHLFERQLTSAVIRGLVRSGVPIVQTFHDYSFVCANYTLMLGMTRPCDLRCTRRGYAQAVRHRCVRGSLAASVLGALELAARRDVFRYHRHVARFLSPSAFLRDALVEGGLDPRSVLHVPNYVPVADYAPAAGRGEYVLFVGRLSFEKGLWTLLEAAAGLPALPFRIVGRGPEAEALQAAVRDRRLDNVTFEGFRSGEELRRLYRGALCVAMPSEWHENGPMVLFEAFASARPVVGTRMGGIPELIEDGRDGLIVPPADAAALRGALDRLGRSASEAFDMGQRAREKVAAGYDVSHHVDRLSEVYDDVTSRGRARRRVASRIRGQEVPA